MNLNIKEIYVFNRALDGKDLVFMPLFKELEISDMVVDAVKEGMIKKGLLKTHGEFTELGLMVAGRLHRYKEAKRHVKIDNLLIGIANEKESILLLWNPLFKEYSIRVVNGEMGGKQISESYDFLMEEADEPKGNIGELISDEDKDMLNVEVTDSFRLSSSFAGNKSEEVYFKKNNILYIYDCLGQILSSESKQNILSILDERMKLS